MRRWRPVSLVEISVLFMTMFMILPWNHDYYYVFALVPISLLFLRAVAARNWALLFVILVAYSMISPPVPFSWIDKTGWFRVPYAYVANYYGLPVLGGLLLWCAATHELLVQASPLPERRWPTRSLIRVALAPAIVIAGLFLWFGRSGNTDSSPAVLGVQPPLRHGARAGLAVSRDGSRVAYIAEGGVSAPAGSMPRRRPAGLRPLVPAIRSFLRMASGSVSPQLER